MIRQVTPWTTRETKACGSAYELGHSLKEIVEALNRDFHGGAAVRTRNMVAGQLDRLRTAGAIKARDAAPGRARASFHLRPRISGRVA